MTSARRALAGLAVAACLSVYVAAASAQASRPALPDRLTDREFWQLIEDLSEPGGSFPSDNLVSNELTFQRVIPELERTIKPGGVYVGVGPDQNFTYIAALHPKMVFIPDIRRGNLHAHLMYKALFKLSASRADFLSRLFSRPRPDGLTTASTALELFKAFADVAPSKDVYDETLKAMLAWLGKQRDGGLTSDDELGVTYVYNNFVRAGPRLSYSSSGGGNGTVIFNGLYGITSTSSYPSYQDLQLADDGAGHNRGYIATEENYAAIKALEERNLIVPLVGDFAGPKTLRSIGAYVKDHDAAVTLFYTSNVEQYLFQGNIWLRFAENVGAMPLDATSTFIRSCFTFCQAPPGSRSVQLLDSIQGLLRDAADGRIRSYPDVLSHVR